MAGLGRYFNSETFTGRANVAKATYASFALIYLYFRLRRGGKQPEIEEPPPPPAESPMQTCPCHPCQPACPSVGTQVPPSLKPPAANDQKKSLTEDPLFKQKMQQQKKSSSDECDDDDYDDKSNNKKSDEK